MSNFLRIRSNSEICPIRRSESGISSQNFSTTQHNIMQNDGATTSRQKNQEKSKESRAIRPLQYFSRPELTKRMREISALLRHPGVRPHPHGRCVCCRGSYPSLLTLTFGDRAGRSRNRRQPSHPNKREGSRRLTVVQGVSQTDPKSETGRNHSYGGSSARS